MPVTTTTIRPDVVRHSKADYDAVIQSFIDAFKRTEVRPISYYQFGQVGHPGISDLDLLVVVKDGDWRAAQSAAVQIIQSHDRFSYVFCHPPVVVSERALPHLTYVHSLFNLEYLSGRQDLLEPYMSADDAGMAFHIIRQTIWNSFLRYAITELRGPSVGLRRTLQLLNNMCHSIESGETLIRTGQESPRSFLNSLRAKILDREGQFDDNEIIDAIGLLAKRLDDTDTQIDAFLKRRYGMAPLHGVCRPLNSWIFFTTFDYGITGKYQKRFRQQRFLSGVLLIPAPVHQFRIIASLASNLSDSHPRLRAFKHLRWAEGSGVSSNFCSAINAFGRHLSALSAICREEHVPYAFPAPFNVTQERWQWGDYFRSAIRQKILTFLAMT